MSLRNALALLLLIAGGPAAAQPANATLGEGSGAHEGRFYEAYTFELRGGGALQVELRSEGFDAFLILVAPDQIVLNNDDAAMPLAGGSNLDSMLSVEAPMSGRWIAIATSFSQEATGAFTLSVAQDAAPVPLAWAPMDDADVRMALEIGQPQTSDGVLVSEPPVVEEQARDEGAYDYLDGGDSDELGSAMPPGWATAEPPSFDAPAADEPSIASEGPALDGPAEPTEDAADAWANAALPWPPPEASSSAVFNRSRLIQERASLRTLGDVDELLVEALTAAGYSGSQYLSAPSGFAVVTQIERIDAGGDPVADEMRWGLQATATRRWSLSSYVSAVLSAPVGYFRVIAIVVSDQPFAAARVEAEFEAVRQWSRTGMNVLPDGVAAQAYTDGYDVSVLVYEFEKSGAGARIILPGRHPVPRHLRHTTLSAYLN